MINNNKISVEELWELFNYDSSTGVFIRKISTNTRHKIGSVAGSIGDSGYVSIKINGVVYKAHRLAWLYEYAEWPSAQIDHINRIRHDNRICNLRDVTQRVNCSNSEFNKGTLGVFYRPDSSIIKPWRAAISYENSSLHLGMFKTELEANSAYQLACLEITNGMKPSRPDVNGGNK